MYRLSTPVVLALLTFAVRGRCETPAAVAASAPSCSAAGTPVSSSAQAAAGCARAPVTAPPLEPAPAALERHWYGWQILTTDGAAITFLLLSGAAAQGGSDSASAALGVTGAAGYVAGGPIVHFAHGQVGKGFGSLGLRVGLPMAGALLAAAAARPCGGDFGCIGEAAVGFLVGSAGAIALDAAVLAHEYKPTTRRGMTTTPLIAVTPERAWIGILGSF